MTLDEIKDAIGVKPYYEEPAGVIYNADCLDILPKIPEKAVDLCLTDPPYNLGIDYKNDLVNDRRDTQDYKQWSMNWFEKVSGIVKDKIVFSCGNKNLFMWGEIQKPTVVMCWHKPNSKGSVPLGLLNHWEPILIYSNNKDKVNAVDDFIYGYVENGFLRPFNSDHYCPKPIRMWTKLLSLFSNPSDIVLDIYLGSGTTMVAAKELGRFSIGIEISEKYCDIAVQRLAQEILL